MKTAEIRGITPQLRGSGTAEIAIICSWFESRYPSSNNPRSSGGFVVYIITISAEYLVTALL